MPLNILLVAAIMLAVFVAVAGYNQLVRARNQVREAWSGIDVQLGRRASLIPNLVETVRGYAHHERQTFEHVIRARGALQAAGGAHAAANANEALSYALSRLFALVESYPPLRASETFSRLQTELSDIEEKIAYARQFYNRTVFDYNTRVHTLPFVVIARTFDFPPAEFFEADANARSKPRVRFDHAAAVAERPAAPPVA